jgi:hypothetical protein
MKSGVNVDILAENMHDDAAHSPALYFYRDEGKRLLTATIQREEIAGMIFLPEDFNSPHRR